MFLNRSFFFLLITISAFACKTPKAVADLTENDIEFTFYRSGCFGKCPIYNLTVYNSGYAVLEKTRFMKDLGKFSRTLKKDELSSLKKAFKNSKFSSYKAEYESNIPDLPSITIGYAENGILKKVKGKDERPAKLMELQGKLEKLVDSEDWKLLEAYPDENATTESQEKQIDPTIYEEIIIEPNSGVRLPKWFKDNEVYGIRLLTKISQEQNLWLITYNTMEYKPEQIMEIIKKDPSIKTAEFNKKLEQRDK